MENRHLSRRTFLRNLAIAAPASSLIVTGPVAAQDLPRLPVDDPQAAALLYVEDAASSTAPNFKPGSNCANCALIQGADGDAYRPCAIFPGKSVAAAGWCSAWAAKP